MRYIKLELQQLCFDENKMAFISGPRQVGKTTFAKFLLAERGVGAYYNWDETTFRRAWAKNPSTVIPAEPVKENPIIILDEIHKAKSWKRSIKGVYDTMTIPCDIVVTGSAKLNIYRRSSDSLLGRYHHFRLHPFSLAEIVGSLNLIEPNELLEVIFSGPCSISSDEEDTFNQLLKFGGFPEPFKSQSVRKLNLWQRGRVEKLIREDLRDMSRLPELSKIEMLASLMPERVANPLSLQSLGEILEVTYNTMKLWVGYLRELYYHYEIKPYSNSLPRTIKKEGKLYLWDWSEVENKGARFENCIASHLLKYCDYLTDTGYGKFELRYVRNKERMEIDFLLIKNGKPWIPIEVKLSDEGPSKNWTLFMPYLKCKYAIQVVKTPGVYKIIQKNSFELLVISASNLLKLLV